MKISVVIPTYNSEKTINNTLDSVFKQTVLPDEIIVLDDGSTDNTVSIIKSYGTSVSLLQHENQGVARTRNELCKRSKGDLVAFLDHDDIWHPKYLETQRTFYEKYPNAVAYFLGHINFFGYGNYHWGNNPKISEDNVEVIHPLSFFKRYNETTGPFGSMSFCCIPKRVLIAIGNEPFCISGVDDSYLCNVLALLGDIIYIPIPLVAYRIIEEAQSSNKLKAMELWVKVFQILEERYKNQPDSNLCKAFRQAYASKRRQFAKRLMGATKTSDARRQLRYSIINCRNPWSMIKSLALLSITYLPDFLQPKWPPSNREW